MCLEMNWQLGFWRRESSTTATLNRNPHIFPIIEITLALEFHIPDLVWPTQCHFTIGSKGDGKKDYATPYAHVSASDAGRLTEILSLEARLVDESRPNGHK